ncbi:MAG TPA: hypothetical protein VGH17_09255, partial [Candidatus Acidoferrales bacterium]
NRDVLLTLWWVVAKQDRWRQAQNLDHFFGDYHAMCFSSMPQSILFFTSVRIFIYLTLLNEFKDERLPHNATVWLFGVSVENPFVALTRMS